MSDLLEITSDAVEEMTPEQAGERVSMIMENPEARKLVLSGNQRGESHAARVWMSLNRKANGAEVEQQPANSYGTPESPNDYKPMEPPPGYEASPELQTDFKGWAHGMGLSQADYTFMEIAWNDSQKKLNAHIQQAADSMGVPLNRLRNSELEDIRAEYLAKLEDEAASMLRGRYGEQAEEVLQAARSVVDRLPKKDQGTVRRMMSSTGMHVNVPLIERMYAISQVQRKQAG